MLFFFSQNFKHLSNEQEIKLKLDNSIIFQIKLLCAPEID